MQVLIDAEGMMKVTHMIQMPHLQHDNWGAMPSGPDSSQQVGAGVFSLASADSLASELHSCSRQLLHASTSPCALASATLTHHHGSDLRVVLSSIVCSPTGLCQCWHLGAEAIMPALLSRLSAAWWIVTGSQPVCSVPHLTTRSKPCTCNFKHAACPTDIWHAAMPPAAAEGNAVSVTQSHTGYRTPQTLMKPTSQRRFLMQGQGPMCGLPACVACVHSYGLNR